VRLVGYLKINLLRCTVI